MGIRDTIFDLGRSAVRSAAAGVLNYIDDEFGPPATFAKADMRETKPTNDPNAVAGGGVPSDEDLEVNDPKSMLWDPFAIIEQLGYKDRPSQITYGTLRAMVYKLPIVQAIIQTRINQIAAFAQPQRDRYQLGYQINLRDEDAKPTAADKKWIKDASQLIAHTGVCNDPRNRDNFEQFLRKVAWDSLTYDQMAFECVPNRMGTPAQWYAIDASTIRIADTASAYHKKKLNNDTKYVQIYDGMIVTEYTEEDLCFGIRNPKTDMKLYGYGTSELEMMMIAITSLLWGWQYNQRFFCTTAGTLVSTTKGLVPVESLSGEVFEVITPEGVKEATAFETGKRSVELTKLSNGLESRTSAEHRFRVVPSGSIDGKAQWREQRELVPGDHVLLCGDRVDAPLDAPTFRIGARYEANRSTSYSFEVTPEVVNDPEFWEMIGFALGDGHWPLTTWNLQIFPRYEKDKPLFQRFEVVCVRHGIHSRRGKVNGYPKIMIHQKPFVRWLYDLGFQASAAGKRIPDSIFQAPASIREALLRGLFSADGHARKHVTGYVTPTVYAANSIFRQDVLKLLWSVGVASNEVGAGLYRKGEIVCQDVEAFAARIGYLQPYKNDNLRRDDRSKYRWDLVHPETSRSIAQQIKSHESFVTLKEREPQQYELVRKAAAGSLVASRPCLMAAWEATVGGDYPEELLSCHSSVDVTYSEQTEELMYDVEVFDDKHLFFGNHMAMHNSQGSAAKGILNFKGSIPEHQMKGFRRHWYTMISGVENAWRTPITNADELQWVDLQNTNRDMEFSQWMDFLIKVTCSAFNMDPIEVNFQYGNAGQKSVLQEASNKEKITQSKERGLRPLLRFLAMVINEHIIWPINDNFELKFVGLDADTHDDVAKRNQMRVKTTSTVDELRAEDGREPMKDGLGEVILDPVWLQWYQQKQAAAMGAPMGPNGQPVQGEQPPGEEAFAQGDDDEGGQEPGLDFQRMLESELDNLESGEETERSLHGKRNGEGLRKAGGYVVDIEL